MEPGNQILETMYFGGARDSSGSTFISKYRGLFPTSQQSVSKPMAGDDDGIVAMAALTCASAAATYINIYGSLAPTLQVTYPPLLRFVRPTMLYRTYLQVQEAVLADNADRIMRDLFRMDVPP